MANTSTTRLLIPLLILVALVLGIVALWSSPQIELLTTSGVVEADEARVGSLIGGRVANVLVQEGAEVQQGDILVSLEPFNLLERQEQAAAQLRAAEAEFTLLEEGFRSEEVEAAQARYERARAALTLAESELSRAQSLRQKQAISQKELDIALERRNSAEASVKESRAVVEQFEEGFRKQEIIRAHALVEARSAELQSIKKETEELNIRAPMGGYVHAIDLVEGDLIAAKAPVMTIIDLSRIWIRTYVPENNLSHRVGDAVQIQCDSYPEKTFSGEISFLSSEAEFTPSNIQTVEDRSKQVYRAKIRKLTPEKLLRPGMFCDVTFKSQAVQ
ncbi:MAG: efflux RND transporter periplasmic adaptor subunit [Bdellovibrionales bacterium]|nr:efflux RND transporter periplasmic adaptor subunit [Bdellovibrionales bacterium]